MSRRGLTGAIAGPLLLGLLVGLVFLLGMDHVQVVAYLVTLLLLGLVVELVRRRRLVERYALLWIIAALTMVVLAVWGDGLELVRGALGFELASNALFTIALGVVIVLLLHFSVAISRLGEEAKILAQEVARLDAELRRERGELPGVERSSAPREAPDA